MSRMAEVVLVVDDDAMNRKLTTMLLNKLGYESCVAASGGEALELVKEGTFGVILMDYRMPEMDGIETTKQLRKMDGPYFKSVPVIALTGEEREDVHRQFLDAGMNDVLAKPVKQKELAAVLERFWGDKGELDINPDTTNGLESCFEEGTESENGLTEEEITFLKTAGVCVQEGIHNCGSYALWRSFLKDFYNIIDLKTTKLAKYLSEGQLKEYTIEVHALKNSARLIGAMELSADFGLLEEWGNQEALEKIKAKNPQVLQNMVQYKKVFHPYAEEADREAQTVSYTQMKEVLWAMKDAVETFDIDTVDFCMEELGKYKIPGCDKHIAQLKAYVADVALEDILEVVSEIIDIIEKAE